jgi:hypothetical protein
MDGSLDRYNSYCVYICVCVCVSVCVYVCVLSLFVSVNMLHLYSPHSLISPNNTPLPRITDLDQNFPRFITKSILSRKSLQLTIYLHYPLIVIQYILLSFYHHANTRKIHPFTRNISVLFS